MGSEVRLETQVERGLGFLDAHPPTPQLLVRYVHLSTSFSQRFLHFHNLFKKNSLIFQGLRQNLSCIISWF